MKIIDCHYHNRHWFDGDKTYLEVQKEYRERNGLDTINVLCAPGNENGSPNGGTGHNCLAAILKIEDSKVYAQAGLQYPFPGDDESSDEFDFKKQTEELRAMGFDGMKMMESKPTTYKKIKYRIDSEKYKEFFAYLEETGFPLIWHVADPESFWDPDKVSQNAKDHGWFYGDGTYPSRDQVYNEVYTILERHPKIKLILCHCFFISGYPQQMIDLLDKYENVYIDLTPGPEMYRDFSNNREVWMDIFNKYYKRFMIGTDVNTGCSDYIRDRLVQDMVRFFSTDDEYTGFEFYGEEYRYNLKGFKLDNEKCEYIFGKSMIEMFGHEPYKMDKKLFKEYVDKYAHRIPEEETRNEVVKYTQNLK